MAFSVRASRPSIVHIVQPSPWPAGNDATIRTDALRKKDDDNSRHKSDGFTIVRLDNGSPFPGGTGSQTRLDEARNNPKKDKDNNRHSRRDGEEITYVRIDHGAPTPGNLDNNVQVEGLSSAPAPKASNPFKNLELSSQARLAAAAPHIPAATPLNPPSRVLRFLGRKQRNRGRCRLDLDPPLGPAAYRVLTRVSRASGNEGPTRGTNLPNALGRSWTSGA
jgi:hypothetical protein